MAEVREITCSPAIFDRLVRISSITPSLKNSLAEFSLMLTKGSTAIDFTSEAPSFTVSAPSCEKGITPDEGGGLASPSNPAFMSPSTM